VHADRRGGSSWRYALQLVELRLKILFFQLAQLGLERGLLGADSVGAGRDGSGSESSVNRRGSWG
jgi:hypothetical protein